MSKDQAIGVIIFIACTVIAIAYLIALFMPALEAFRFWIIAAPVAIGFIIVMVIGAWIGWTMATTPPPKPIEEITREVQEENTA